MTARPVVRLLVFEALSGGGFPGELPPRSWLTEGLAMRDAVVRDCAKAPWLSVTVMRDVRLPQATLVPGPNVREAVIDPVVSVETELSRLAEDHDYTLVIAPETGSNLQHWVRCLEESNHRHLNAAGDAIAVASNKLLTAERLQAQGIATPDTSLVDWSNPPPQAAFPLVVKPVDGAGSWLVRRVDRPAGWNLVAAEYASANATDRAIWQPVCIGRPLSVAAAAFGKEVSCYPVATQTISDDGHFTYLGGMLPASVSAVEQAAIDRVLEHVLAAIPGLRGYFGLDLLVTDDEVAVVDVNPRLTTSFVGLAALSPASVVAEWILAAEREAAAQSPSTKITLVSGLEGRLAMFPAVRFDAAGNIVRGN